MTYVCNRLRDRGRDEMDIVLWGDSCFREHKSPLIWVPLSQASTTLPPSAPSLNHSEPAVLHLSLHSLLSPPPSFAISFLGGSRGGHHFLSPACFPLRTCAQSVHFHLFPNKSKQLVTDWNTAFCCFPCCTDNGHAHRQTGRHCYAPMLPECVTQTINDAAPSKIPVAKAMSTIDPSV